MDELQQALENGEFNLICTNEITLKNYIALILQRKVWEIEKLPLNASGIKLKAMEEFRQEVLSIITK